MDRHCPHRRASLVFGRNEDCGLRCLYHGWKVDVEGNVLEMPSEPSASTMAQKVKHKAYPTHEHGGFVWVYMGPRETMPAFRPPPFAPTTDARLAIVKIAVRLQLGADSRRRDRLGAQLDAAFDRHDAGACGQRESDGRRMVASIDRQRPRASCSRRPDYGFKYAAIRRPITNANVNDYVRISVFVAPISVLYPAQQSIQRGQRQCTDRRYTHDVSFHCMDRRRRRGRRYRSVAQVLSRANRHRCRSRIQEGANAGQPLPAGSQGDAPWRFHRHSRHSEPGHRDVGNNGPDCRSHD
jgi:hypothetical protein